MLISRTNYEPYPQTSLTTIAWWPMPAMLLPANPSQGT